MIQKIIYIYTFKNTKHYMLRLIYPTVTVKIKVILIPIILLICKTLNTQL